MKYSVSKILHFSKTHFISFGIIAAALVVSFAFLAVTNSRVTRQQQAYKNAAAKALLQAKQNSIARAKAVAKADSQQTQPSSSETVTPTESTSPAKSTAATSPKPQPVEVPSIKLFASGAPNIAAFTTVNFTSTGYLVVVQPIKTTYLHESIVTPYGISLSPYGMANSQGGTVTINHGGLRLAGGDSATFAVCANVNGQCGLMSNTITMTVTAICQDGAPSCSAVMN